MTRYLHSQSARPVAAKPPSLRAAIGAQPQAARAPRHTACACGGGCPRCQARPDNRLLAGLSIQAKLSVGAVDDPLEREADQVAEQVMRMPAPALQRSCASCTAGGATCAKCAEEKNNLVQRRSESASDARASVSENFLGDLGPGQPLDAATRDFFEPRFGHDFSRVRVHTDERAAESARSVSALAYTVGSHVVFAQGRHAPLTSSGRALMAHELAHVAAPAGGLIQRAPDPAALTEFDDRVAKLRALPAFVAVKDATAKKELEEIIKEARKRDNALYYIEKLELLFNTPEMKAEEQAAEFSGKIAGAATEETTRLATPEGTAGAGREEAVAAVPSRVFTPRAGQDGTTFLIDARDLTNIAVRAKVRLQAKGKGTSVDVANVRQIEDAIEKKSSTLGYSVDLEFVDKSGPDVFTVGVDPSGWPTSGNWVTQAEGLAHELHHLLGLDDLYDYIERHAANPKMKTVDRIHWFRVQMNKTPDPQAGKSIMGRTTTGRRNLPSDEDVCRVAGVSAADFDACVEKRAEARRNALQPAISSAGVTTYRAFELLSNIKPLDPAEDPALRGLKQRRASGMAQNIFGAPISMSSAEDIVDDMRFALAVPNLYLVSELEPECSQTAFTVSIFPRIRLCPAFLSLSTAAQADLLLREAAHFVGASDGTSDAPCPGSDCASACGDSNNAEAWARWVKCVASIR